MAKRLFIAINITPEPVLINFLTEFRELFQPKEIRWVNENNLHLTIKYLGNTEENTIPKILAKLDKASKNFVPFSFQLNGLGIFGTSENPKIIFSKINPEKTLKELSIKINETLSFIGIKKETKGFRAHLTFGRIKFIQNKSLFYSQIDKHLDTHFQNIHAK